ncbi:MAG: 1-acyl-sn-glycerol-3-phosphate acyltransferase, partial [Verrucomicrobia bacterium]
MEEWRFEPAHDFGLSAEQRRLSLRREVGLESAISCFLWRSITRLYLAIAHRLRIRGRENLPTHPPFVLVANHASHLDAIILGGILPLRFVGAVFPIAAGDTFFTKR